MTEQLYPPDLQAILNELDRTDAEARQLVARLNEAQLNWQPGGGTGWSVAQCLEHLAQSTDLYTPALQAAVRKAKASPAPPQETDSARLAEPVVYQGIRTSAQKEDQGAKEGNTSSATQQCGGAKVISCCA